MWLSTGGAVPSPLLTSLVAYWKLDEASGTRNDSHGTNHLTDNNTVGSVAGKVGNAADFIRANLEYLSRADGGSGLNFGDVDFTFAAWIRIKSKPALSMQCISKWTPGSLSYVVEWNVADRFRFWVSSDGSAFAFLDANSLGSPALNTWYFVAAWHAATADNINIQVNNGTVDSAAYSAGVFASNAAFYLGRYHATDDYHLDGAIDEAGAWSRLLTADERTQLYNGGAGQAYPFA